MEFQGHLTVLQALSTKHASPSFSPPPLLLRQSYVPQIFGKALRQQRFMWQYPQTQAGILNIPAPKKMPSDPLPWGTYHWLPFSTGSVFLYRLHLSLQAPSSHLVTPSPSSFHPLSSYLSLTILPVTTTNSCQPNREHLCPRSHLLPHGESFHTKVTPKAFSSSNIVLTWRSSLEPAVEITFFYSTTWGNSEIQMTLGQDCHIRFCRLCTAQRCALWCWSTFS